MTYTELRGALKDGRQLIRWPKSGIIEVANLEPNGAVRIFNVVSGKAYILPRRMSANLHIEFVPKDSMVTLGSLVPKNWVVDLGREK